MAEREVAFTVVVVAVEAGFDIVLGLVVAVVVVLVAVAAEAGGEGREEVVVVFVVDDVLKPSAAGSGC